MRQQPDTIYAVSTPAGPGAIAIIRISGREAHNVIRKIIKPVPETMEGYRVYFGYIVSNTKVIDQVLINSYLSPRSYTGEDMIEINCHGSNYVKESICKELSVQGLRQAEPGEFTMRAFLNGKLDLSQAEAVADLVSAHDEQAHKIAINQLRGGVSRKLNSLRENLLSFSALIELELDFSQEEVEFADRNELTELASIVKEEIAKLINSFEFGNAIKKGVPVAILGRPNAGKSTLLNTLLDEEKAIVSEIPGTTRDSIEDVLMIDGITFRLIDTAGLRHSHDEIEKMGIARSYQKASIAKIILLIVDPDDCLSETAKQVRDVLAESGFIGKMILVINKIDAYPAENLQLKYKGTEDSLRVSELCFVSAKNQIGIEELKQSLVKAIKPADINSYDTIISNTRHLDALKKAERSIERVLDGLKNNIAEDLISQDIRETLHHLGVITGEINTEEVLGKVFSSFCIGK